MHRFRIRYLYKTNTSSPWKLTSGLSLNSRPCHMEGNRHRKEMGTGLRLTSSSVTEFASLRTTTQISPPGFPTQYALLCWGCQSATERPVGIGDGIALERFGHTTVESSVPPHHFAATVLRHLWLVVSRQTEVATANVAHYSESFNMLHQS